MNKEIVYYLKFPSNTLIALIREQLKLYTKSYPIISFLFITFSAVLEIIADNIYKTK